MLVLVSFVLVLAAAVTLVVGLLQSGLALIYLSIGCSVLAGVVLAVAVLRGRPEARPAAAGGRSFTPPQRAEVPVGVGASTSAGASSTETTSSWSSPPVSTPPPPPPPPPPPGEDLATRAAGSALLGRLRGRRAEQDAGEPTVVAAPAGTSADDGDGDLGSEPAAAVTTELAAPAADAPREAADGFPIEDFDRLRATELLAMLPSLDRNQLEAVRHRESAGKNRFTIMSRVDALLASKAEPAWEAADDDWEDGVGGDAESEAVAIEAQAIRDEDGFGDELDREDEVDELVSPSAAGFPIAGYDALTVGQILPRLSELGGGELAEVRAREQQGRNRGTILDRIDRLSARAGAAPSGALAMPSARKAPARKAVAAKATGRKAPAPAPAKAPAPSTRSTGAAAKKARAPRAAGIAVPPAAPAPVPAKATRKSPAKKAAAVPVAPVAKAARKSPAGKAAATQSPPAKAGSSMKDAVKKARAAKKG